MVPLRSTEMPVAPPANAVQQFGGYGIKSVSRTLTDPVGYPVASNL
jgi:hypothetical protein